MASTKFLFLLYFAEIYSSKLATGEGFLLLKLIQKMDKFNLDAEYQRYLDLVNLNEEEMHPIQKIETKRAFFGGVGSVVKLISDDVKELEELDARKAMMLLRSQVVHFFEQTIKEQERRCTYCGSNEPCEGAYPEGCFFEEQILK